MAETTKQRTDRLMGMSHGQLVMHCQDLTRQRDLAVDALDTAIKAIKIFRNEPALERLHNLRSSEGYATLQQATDTGTDALSTIKESEGK